MFSRQFILWWEFFLQPQICDSHTARQQQRPAWCGDTLLVNSFQSVYVLTHTVRHLRLCVYTFPLAVTGVIWTCFFLLFIQWIQSVLTNIPFNVVLDSLSLETVLKWIKILFEMFIFCTNDVQALKYKMGVSSLKLITWQKETNPALSSSLYACWFWLKCPDHYFLGLIRGCNISWCQAIQA